jgi:F0F1-type ATP synthase gamma subunit
MQDKNKINQQIDLIGTLKMLVESYEEISVLRMQRVKSSVLLTREFLDSLSQVFADVKANYRHEFKKMIEKKKNQNKFSFSTIQKNGKTVSVFLSSNSKFYGDIVQKVFQEFLADIEKSSSDIVIVGRVGRELFSQSGVKKDYQYYDLSDQEVKTDDLKNLVMYLIKYEFVHVYHGKFNNMVTQLAAMSNISGEQTVEEDQKEVENPFFFEPSLDKILNFFETQVFTSLFKQTINESELSRLASRIKAMEEAFGNIDKTEGELGMAMRKANKNTQNKKQIDSLVGIYYMNMKKGF